MRKRRPSLICTSIVVIATCDNLPSAETSFVLTPSFARVPPSSPSWFPHCSLSATITGEVAEADDTGDEHESDIKERAEFTTPPMRLYIEDTDAYGVMLNSNYLKAFDRAFHGMSVGFGGESITAEGVMNHDGWYVTEVARQKFRASPPLGGEYVIRGKLVESMGGGTREVWDMEMTSLPSEKRVMYNSALVTISMPASLVPDESLPPKPEPLEPHPDSKLVENLYTTYRDEFDLHLGSTHLPLQSALNLFRRSQSDFLGGPVALRQLKDKDNIVLVVTGIDKCALVNMGHRQDEEDKEEGDASCSPGQAVSVKNHFWKKRKGAVVECRQTLLVPGVKRRRRLAQAVITIMALDAETRRPSKNLPKWFLDLW